MSTKKTNLKAAMGPRKETGTPVAATFVNAKETGETQTSVRLPADLHKQARYYSIDNGISLNQLIVEGLRLRLAQ